MPAEKEDNRDVQIWEGKEDEADKVLREYREKMAAMLT
jgi:hypothetical protein